MKDGAAGRARARQRTAWSATSGAAKCSAMQWRSRGTAAMSSAEYGAMASSMPSERSTSCWSRVKIRCGALVVQVRIERVRRRPPPPRRPVRREGVGRPCASVARRIAHRVDLRQQRRPVRAERGHASSGPPRRRAGSARPSSGAAPSPPAIAAHADLGLVALQQHRQILAGDFVRERRVRWTSPRSAPARNVRARLPGHRVERDDQRAQLLRRTHREQVFFGFELQERRRVAVEAAGRARFGARQRAGSIIAR